MCTSSSFDMTPITTRADYLCPTREFNSLGALCISCMLLGPSFQPIFVARHCSARATLFMSGSSWHLLLAVVPTSSYYGIHASAVIPPLLAYLIYMPVFDPASLSTCTGILCELFS